MAATVTALDSSVERFDILDDFGRVFWRDMSAEDALRGAGMLGTLYRVVPATGLDYGAKA